MIRKERRVYVDGKKEKREQNKRCNRVLYTSGHRQLDN